ncbi:STAS domain-containing protein [Ottowia sp.]|uniref:STAS domain-containing protein n=1 Tax=Ottowia sp. TaxID=1898956 RepID=UPI003A8BC67D
MSKTPDTDGSGNSSSRGGLLSKMVKFVKSPTTHWADLDRPEPADSGHSESRLALKEMIERKRRNDFVRNREFDMLRKLRRKEKLNPEDALPGPSYFPSEQPADNQIKREHTIKKIDEIEAQMSTTWLKRPDGQASGGQTASVPATNQAAAASTARAPDITTSAHAPSFPHSSVSPSSASHSSSSRLPMENSGVLSHGAAERLPGTFVHTVPMDDAEFEAELARIRAGKHAQAAASAPAAMPMPPAMPPSAMPATTSLRPTAAPHVPKPIFTDGDFLGGMVGDFQVEVAAPAKLDPEIEEVAVRFANGDAEGAEAGLLELLAEGGRREDDTDTWLTLFDLYRATDAQDKFDGMALQFAARFGRSAPQWGREAVVSPGPVASTVAPVAKPAGTFHWVCPASLNAQSFAALNGALARSPQPWRIDWRKLKTMELDALPILDNLFKRWASEPVQLRFAGAEHVLQILEDHSPADDRSADPQWWGTRLNLLRVMGEMDQFDFVALSYCVTYEVSPPAWEDPASSYSPLSDEGHTLLPDEGDQAHDSLPTSQFGHTEPPPSALGGLGDGIQRAELTGELVGSAETTLQAIRIDAGMTVVELNCRTLRRVDFGAAGDLLNWAMAQGSLGRAVTFKQVNRLVAAFFGVIGITENASVVLRAD